MSPFVAPSSPVPTDLRLALLPSVTPSGEVSSAVYARAAREFSLPASSMPAFRAHLTRRLDAALRAERLPTETRPQLAMALTEYVRNKQGLGTEGRAFARRLELSFRRMELVLQRIVAQLREPGAGAAPSARTRLSAESKMAITREIVLQHGSSPLLPGDARITLIGEQFGATRMQVAALKAWVTMRTAAQLRAYEVSGDGRLLSSGVIALAGQLAGRSISANQSAFQRACDSLARSGGAGDVGVVLGGAAQELAALLFPRGYGRTLSADLRSDLVSAWGFGKLA